MSYAIKEIFHTIQGEGINAGRAAVFCRFAGCNLWSGRKEDQAGAVCNFCDTDFIGGFRAAHAMDLAWSIEGQRPLGCEKFVVLTGGEPLLQVDKALIYALHFRGFEIAAETNGTILAPKGIDWLTVSPKANSTWVQRTGNELKLVYPQVDLMPDDVERTGFDHYLLQPMDGQYRERNTADAIEHCKRGGWRLSLQSHKWLGIR